MESLKIEISLAEQIFEILEKADGIISLFAVGVIVIGFLIATVRYARRFLKIDPEKDFNQFKIDLGTALLLGLEILVVADVIETITTPQSYQSLAGLAFLVIIRTIMSWTLTLEVEGRWPWEPENKEENV